MKSFTAVIATIAFALIGTVSVAQAEDLALHGNVGVANQNVYRGELLSADPTGFGTLRVDNILLDGLFVEGSASTLNTSPLSDIHARTELNVGWHGQWDRLGAEFSVARVWNTKVDYVSIHNYNLYNLFDYNEARAKVSYQLNDTFKVYGIVGQGFNNPDFKNHPLTGNIQDYRYLTAGANTYGAVGAETKIGDNLTVGGLVSGEHYDNAGRFVDGDTRYNNSEVYASLNLAGGLNVFGAYSFGGKNVVKEDVANQATFGVQYSF